MYKEKLIKYVQAKNDYIKSMTDIDYVTKEDIDDIMCWKEEECEQIWKNLDPTREIDGCPWCLKVTIKYGYVNCDDCGYRSRNGECGEDGSRIDSIHKMAVELDVDDILTSNEIIEIYNRINNEKKNRFRRQSFNLFK